MEGLRPFAGAESENLGEYSKEWLRLRDAFCTLFTTKDGLVVNARPPKRFEGAVVVGRGPESSHEYSVVFTNAGEKPKFNPNKVNFFVNSKRVFSKCLVSDCEHRPSASGNLQGLCQGKNHRHLEPTEAEPKDTHEAVYYLRYTHPDGHLETEGPMDYSKAKSRADEDTRIWGPAPMSRLDHFVDWVGVMRQADGSKEMFAPWHAGPSEFLLAWVGKDETKGHSLDDFVRDVLQNAVVGHTKDSTTMQLEYERGAPGPAEVVQAIGKVVDKHFGGVNDFADWKWNGLTFADVPIKAAAAMLALGFAAEEANRGDYWFAKEVLGQPLKSHYASAYMSSAYYFLRRAGASESQARMTVMAMTR